MTPNISIRSYTTDQYYLDKVFYSNFYQLSPAAKSPSGTGVVVDIGAHCGFFALTAMAAGYTRCYCFEPHAENYQMLLKNTEVFSEVVSCFQLGVKPAAGFFGLEAKEPDHRQFVDYGLFRKGPTNAVAIGLSQIKELVPEQIRLLKINTGEAFDFADGDLLDRVNSLCFELPYSPDEATIVSQKLRALGFSESLLIELKENDQNFGFLGFFSKDKLENTFDIEHLKSKNYET